MGLSSKKTKTTSAETISPNAAYAPQINAAAADLKPGFDQATALVSKYTPTLDQGVNYYGDVLSGKFLGQENPWLQPVLDRTNQDILNGVGSQFTKAGRYGSAYNTDTAARAIADNENQLRFGNYQTERGYQQQAAGQQGDLISRIIALQQLPGSANAEAINALLGKYVTSNGTSTSKTSGGLLGSVLGSVLGGVATGGLGTIGGALSGSISNKFKG